MLLNRKDLCCQFRWDLLAFHLFPAAHVLIQTKHSHPYCFSWVAFHTCEEPPFCHCLFLEGTKSIILLEGYLYDSMWLALTEVACWHFMLIWAAIHEGSHLTFSGFNPLSLSWWQTVCWHWYSDIRITPHPFTLQACHVIKLPASESTLEMFMWAVAWP